MQKPNDIDKNAKVKNKQVTHPYFLLFIVVAVAFVLTWVIPAGQYERYEDPVTGRTIVDPASFQFVESNPAGIGDFFLSFYEAFNSSSGVLAITFFVGAAFGVLNGIGIISAAMKSLATRMANRPFWVLATVVMAAIALHHSFTGSREIDVVFVAIIIPLCMRLGYDTMTGVSMTLFGSLVGSAAALANPFSTGLGHQLAELPIYSAMWYRFIIWVVFLIIGVIVTSRYAKKVKLDPSSSITLELEEMNHAKFMKEEESVNDKKLTVREKLSGVVLVGIFAFLVYGTMNMGFGFAEIAASFMAIALVCGFVAGRGLNEICYMMTQGMRDILPATFVILLARAVLVLMEGSMVVDTIVYFLSSFIIGSSSLLSASVIFFVQCIINFFIPSGSGQMMVTMPIIVPLSDMGEVTRQTAALASQLGDGLTNYIYPSNGGLIATLAVASVGYGKWIKFAWKALLLMVALCIVFVSIAQLIGLQ